MSDSWYYDFINPDHALRVNMLKNNCPWFDLRYINDIVNTRISMWTYEGLPEGLTSTIVETALLFRIKLCFVDVKGLNKWVLGYYVPVAVYDEYYQPREVDVYTLSGNKHLGRYKWSEIVIVRDNPMDLPPFITIMEYVEKIKELENDMFILCDHASLPLVLTGDKKQANALRQQAKEFGHKHAFIVGDSMAGNSVTSYDIKLPINPLDIYDIRSKYINECMSAIGIYSVEQKRERIVTQELVNQNDKTDFIYNKYNNERKRWIKEMNARGNNMRLIESYEENIKDVAHEKALTANAVIKAEGEAIKDLDPNAEFSQSNPVKVTTKG